MSAFDRHTGIAAISRRTICVRCSRPHSSMPLSGEQLPFFNLYRGLMILRGESLIADARRGAERTAAGLLVRAGMAAFRPLLRLNLPRSPFGWQTVGVAREPSSRPRVRIGG